MPLGIGKLKSLQTLSKIIIGGDDGFAITDFQNLPNLRGEISIEGLEKVQNAMHAREAKLWQKNLSELKVKWDNVFDDSPTETLDKEALDVLKPHKDTLKKLRVVSYGGIGFPSWVGDPSFLCLTFVSIRGCKKCTSLPSLGRLSSLKRLFIEGMDEVRVVDAELHGIGVAFPSLKFLTFESMKGWKVWSTNCGAFPCLEDLRIRYCPNLIEVSLEALPSLRHLEVKRSGHGVLRNPVQIASSVTELKISCISGLTDQRWRDIIKYLGKVKDVTINKCDEIRYLWESEADACKVLVNLRNLEVVYCKNLTSLGEEEDDNCGGYLTSLRMLEVLYCDNMVRCSCPTSIKKLCILGCTSITSISFTTGGQKLRSLAIDGCQTFLENELGGGGDEDGEKARVLINKSMLVLEVVTIQYWSNLKSIVALSCFTRLTDLTIKHCPNMESFPDHELPNLTKLKYMLIEDCPSMDDSFPRGLWPPQLSSLAIGGLKRPLSEFGPQNFPTSLVSLRLLGRSSEGVTSCTYLSHLLPSSLTSLDMRKFKGLESLSTGLQHLTSLQHLSIDSCPKTKDLPEMLCPSLLGLSIFKCPNLDNTYNGKDSYSRLIWPIPFLAHDWS